MCLDTKNKDDVSNFDMDICFLLTINFRAYSQNQHLARHNEAVELPDGNLIGEVTPVTNYGLDSTVIYSIEPDGHYHAVDSANGTASFSWPSAARWQP